jgi:vacuolar protein sorting-associated protein 26
MNPLLTDFHFFPDGDRIVNMKFSARYYLNLVLVDEENRRYFKQQEITIFRRQVDDQAVEGPAQIQAV